MVAGSFSRRLSLAAVTNHRSAPHDHAFNRATPKFSWARSPIGHGIGRAGAKVRRQCESMMRCYDSPPESELEEKSSDHSDRITRFRGSPGLLRRPQAWGDVGGP